MRKLIVYPLVVAAGLASAGPAASQHISGVIYSGDSGTPLAGVHLTLAEPGSEPVKEVVSNEDGWFGMNVPHPGVWVVRGERIGYASMRSDPIPIALNEHVTVEIRLDVEAVRLDPLLVSGRAEVAPGLTGFYSRMGQSRLGGRGSFLETADIDRLAVTSPSQIFRNVASVRVRPGRRGHGEMLRMAGGCVPALYLDGVQINKFDHATSLDDFVDTDAIAAIEVYRDAWVEGFTDARGCGLVLVWTRKGSPQESLPTEAPTWLRLTAGTALLGLILVLLH